MRSIIKKCKHCNIYTLKSVCANCNNPTVLPLPPRYSPEDRWGKYRRRLKYQKGES